MNQKIIRAGTIARLKVPTILGNKGIGILTKDIQPWDTSVEILIDSGTATALRDQVSIYGKGDSVFIIKRLRLPYGKWTCEGGREVLFNRQYYPIWERDAHGEVKKANPKEHIENIKESVWFYGDQNPPTDNKKTTKKCLDILNEWEVFNHIEEKLCLDNEMVKMYLSNWSRTK